MLRIATPYGDAPPTCLLIPPTAFDFRVQPDMFVQTVLAGELFKVRGNFTALGVVVRPDLLGEGIAVHKAVEIDPSPGITVILPDAADVGVLLQNDERHASLLESVAHQQT